MFETTNQSCSLLPNSKNHLRNATAKYHLKTKRLQALTLKLPESKRPKSELFQRNWSLDTARSTKPCALPFGTPKELLRNSLGVVDVKIFREAPKPKSWPSVHCSCALGHLDGFCNLMITAVFPFVLLQELFRLSVVHLDFLLHICSSMQQEYLKFLSPACLPNKQVPFTWTLPWNMKALQRRENPHQESAMLGPWWFPSPQPSQAPSTLREHEWWYSWSWKWGNRLAQKRRNPRTPNACEILQPIQHVWETNIEVGRGLFSTVAHSKNYPELELPSYPRVVQNCTYTQSARREHVRTFIDAIVRRRNLRSNHFST